MSNELFEKKLAQELKGLSMQPSGAVWPQVEKRIQKERKRRMIFWWIVSSSILIAGTGIWLSEEKSTRDEEKTSHILSKTTIEDASSNKKLPISEETNAAPPSSLPTKEILHEVDNRSSKKWQNRYQEDKIHPEEFDTELTLTAYAPQNRMANPVPRAGLMSNGYTTENLTEKIDDTIIVVNCNNIPPPTPFPEKKLKNIERQLNFNGFLSFHGTGDLSGTNLEFGIERKWGKRYGFYNNLGITIHSGQEAGFGTQYPLQLNSTYKSLQTVTAGIQTMPTFYRYSKRGDLKIGAGLVARYQMTSSSMYGARGMGPGTNQYSYSIYEVDPNTFSLGYRISADLLLYETKKNKLGFQLYFQNDTRGDVLTGMGLSFQTKYKK